MGGDSVRGEEESSSDPDLSRSSSPCSVCFRDDAGVNGGDSEEFGTKPSVRFSSREAERRKREKVYKDVLQSYDLLPERISSLNASRLKLLSYSPGAWGGRRASEVKLKEYDVPETTSIILVGLKGSGKSSLINRIIRVIEDDRFAPDSAQISNGSSSSEGTFFLQEYEIPRASPTFSLYDTRGLCQNSSDNISTIKRWITQGVRHGNPVIWKSDCPDVKKMLKLKTHGLSGIGSKTRKKINFVIFVVNAVDVLKSMESSSPTQSSHAQMISTAFNCPFLSFKDDKPAVVMTHGDILSREERARARVFLGDLLGIPADRQIFDIPESQDAATELTICDLLRHCLEHADKNLLQFLPSKNSFNFQENGVIQWTICTSSFILLLAVALVVIVAYYHAPKPPMGAWPKPNVLKGHARKGDWGKMRHLWFDDD
ncbi:PREDICTED: uncharacterized protein LOC104821658 isoform X2 [Tarenaya hassleriana]|uniref:uncharacterized protein LOC104821658 isoform X2 n=1 Tax=Tarenaya hassleriana TaxID=28532 RepID=UPI00053C7789|nr:PREDICTED: uncharacterized protein LOC104821658 isoform X2 [Tarenaya hassleriana]